MNETKTATASWNRAIVAMAVAVMMAMLVVVSLGGCGRPTTLEEYFDAHPNQLQAMKDEAEKGNGQSVSSVSMSAEGNQLNVAARCDSSVDDALRNTDSSYFDKYWASRASEQADAIKELEDMSGIQGITIRYQMMTSDGTVLTEHTFS